MAISSILEQWNCMIYSSVLLLRDLHGLGLTLLGMGSVDRQVIQAILCHQVRCQTWMHGLRICILL